MNAYQPYQPKNQSINLPGIGLVKAPECVDHKPLIQCELQELEEAIGLLEVAVQSMIGKLEPLVCRMDQGDEKECPCPPECALPPLGVSLRLLRRRVQSAAVRLSEAGNSVEL